MEGKISVGTTNKTMVTIRDLAEELGLSNATVSLALRASPLIPEATAKRVRELAALRKYVPNHIARALRCRRSHLVGYLMSSVTASFYGELFEGICQAASQVDYAIVSGWAKDKISAQLQLFLEKNVDGVIVCGPNMLSGGELQRMAELGKPVVFCSSLPPPEFDCVVNDDLAGGIMAVEYLCSLGHREIAVSGADTLRRRGNLEAARRCGARCYVFDTDEALLALLEAQPEITAVVAFCDREAIELARILAACGKKIPEDLSLIGFDDLWFAGLPEFHLTTIAQQRASIGQLSFERMLEKINGDNSVKQRLLAPYLVERSTTGVPHLNGC